jgi:hypothetical protein
MMICIEDLNRANERVLGYGRALEKKGGRDRSNSSKFNIKDFVFQLGRHFCHNLSSIDHRIRQLKQNLNPMADTEAQTEHSHILLAEHEAVSSQLKAELELTAKSLGEYKAWLTIEQRKYKEIEELNLLL